MLSLDYVKEHISEIELDNLLHQCRFTKRFVDFLPTSEWKKFGFEYQGKEEHIPKEWTEENVITQLKYDLDFAIEKALGQRGISASLMNDVLRSWCIVLENGLENIDYGWYGDSLIKAIDEYYDFGLYEETKEGFIESRLQCFKDSIFKILQMDGYKIKVDEDVMTVELGDICTAKIQITKGE